MRHLSRALPVLIVASLIFAGNSQAGNEGLVKQRAKNLRDNLSETPPPDAGGAKPPPSNPTPPPPPTLTPTQTSIAKIQSEISAIVTKGEATDDLKQRLTQALLSSAIGGGKPSETSAQSFASSLADSIAGKDVNPQARSQIAVQLNTICNSLSLSPDQVTKTISDFQATLRLAGIPRRDAADIGDELKSLSDEVRKPAGK